MNFQRCSWCGYIYPKGKKPECPYCGFKMIRIQRQELKEKKRA